MQKMTLTELPYDNMPCEGIHYHILKRCQYGHTALLRLDAGCRLPAQRHPGWVKLVVLTGRLVVNDHSLHSHDVLMLPAGTVYTAHAENDVLCLAVSEAGRRGAGFVMLSSWGS
ncbi:cupin domain-containing protein (plasmid) [Klebsiella sp. WOUb02]|uniref:cupin domain-containing protein n=1 Tax=Klebsiella sp. WOUb02 TaxID=3161071 RepID=UPI003CF70B20